MMKKEKFYVNMVTGERTEVRSDAMLWYRSGIPVEVWKNGRKVLSLLM